MEPEQGATWKFDACFTALIRACQLKPDSIVARLRKAGTFIGRSALYDWMKGEHLPEDGERFLAVVHLCTQAARHRNASLDSLPRTDEDWLKALANARSSRGDRPVNGHSGPDLPGRLINDWSPVALGVHPSIGGAQPVYVVRGYDALLRAVMSPECAANRLILLRGGSSTGKSRAAFEAVHAQLPTWKVDYPGSGEMLAKRLEAGIRSRTVLWLGDLRGYVQTRLGQSALSMLGDLFGRQGHLIVITAVWPELWGLFTKDPNWYSDAAGPPAWLPDGFRQFLKALPVLADDQIMDIYPSAGGVLDVPDRFTATELQRAHDLARQTGDVLLREVLEVAAHAGTPGEISQHAAGAAHLREHYDGPGADPYGCALITAAMDLSRLGVSGPFSPPLLISAAEGYLSDRQRAIAAQDWQVVAVKYASSQLRGNLYALEPVPPEHGFGVAGYRLADYLDQYGRQRRRQLLIPGKLWNALISEIDNAEERIRLAREAEYRGLNQVAAELAAGPAEAGAPDAMQLIARQWNRMGSAGQAITWYRRCLKAAPNDHITARRLADLLEQVGRAEEAGKWRDAFHRGMIPLAIILGGEEENEDEIRLLAEAGDVQAMLSLAGLLRDEGQDDEAVRWYREAAKCGEMEGVWEEASLLEEQGHVDQAADLLHPYAEAENREAVWRLYQLLERHEREDEALVWIQRDVSLGNPIALAKLGGRLYQQGAHIEAERLYRAWAEEKKDPAAMWYLAEHLAEANRTEEAVAWFQRSAEDSYLGMNILVETLEKLGCAQAAEAPLKAWAAKGDTTAMDHLARLYENLGRNGEAEHIHRLLVELGDFDGYPRLPGQTSSSAITDLADFLERTDHAAEASQLRKFGIKPGGVTAQSWQPPEP